MATNRAIEGVGGEARIETEAGIGMQDGQHALDCIEHLDDAVQGTWNSNNRRFGGYADLFVQFA